MLSTGWLASFDLSQLAVLLLPLLVVVDCGNCCDSLPFDESVVAGFGLDGFSVVASATTAALVVAVVADVDVVVEEGVGVLQAGVGEATLKLVGLGVLGRRWHSVQPRRNRVTASRGRNAYVSVI